ncbi:hypothetical protein [Planomonospora alba]
MNTDKTGPARAFASSGTKLALAVFLGGAKGLVFFTAVRDYPTDVASAYGTSLTITLAVMMLGVGLNVIVVQRLAGKATRSGLLPEETGIVRSMAAVAVASTLVLATGVAFAGLAISLLDENGLTSAAYWSRVPSLLLIPVENLISGLLIVRGREGANLRTTLENFILTFLSALVLPWFGLDAVSALIVIGAFCVIIDILTVIRQWVRLGPVGKDLVQALKNGAPEFFSQPAAHLRTMLSAVAGASDGLIMMSSFAVVTALASRVSPEAAAITAVLISVIRTIVVPLKQYGLVAGKLTKAARGPDADPRSHMRLFITMVSAVMTLLGITFIVAPQLIAYAIGIERPSGGAMAAIRISGVQLLMEPLAGFASAALKVLTTPSAAMRPLMISMFGIALPAMLVFHFAGGLTLIVIWSTLLTARLVFCVQVLTIYLRWERNMGVPHAV